MKIVSWLIKFALLVGILGGCQPAGQTLSSLPGIEVTPRPGEAATSEAELRLIDQFFPPGLDPVHEYGGWYLLRYGAAERLLRVSPAGEIVPELAESIQAIDPTTWEVKLRPDLRFWSGAVVDAEAVKASLERSRRLDPAAAPLLAGVMVEVVDSTTIRFTTEVPNAWFPLNLADFILVIHNAAVYGDEPNLTDPAKADLTGPFRLTAFTPNQEMGLEAWSGYWGSPPRVERLHLRVIDSPEARVLAAQSGEADIIGEIPTTSVAALSDSEEMKLVEIGNTVTMAVYLNLTRPVFEDVRVRQALSWAIDRQDLIEVANSGYGQPAASFLAAHPFYPEAAEQGYTRYDPDRAAQLLDEAGWRLDTDGTRKKDGQPLEFRLVTYGLEKTTGELLQNQWGKLGVRVEVQHVDDYGIIQTRLTDGDWDALAESWVRFGNPLVRLTSHFQPGGDANKGGYNDPIMNEILEEMGRSVDEEELRQLVLKANERVNETVPLINLYTVPDLAVISKDLEGFQPHFLGEYWVTADLSIQRR